MSSTAAVAAKRILLVEDEAIVARDLERSLVRLGYEISGVEMRGEDAIARVERDDPDLVLMDVRLRGMIDGIDAVGEIWRRFAVPSVILTAYADDDTVARARREGAFAYLIKPFEPRELKATIEMVLERGAEGRAALRREGRLFDLLGRLGDGVALVDGAGRFVRLNAVAERLLGASAGELARSGTTAERLVGDGADGADGAEEARLQSPAGEIAVQICRLPLGGLSGATELMVFRDPRRAVDADQRILRREVSSLLQQVISGVVHGVGTPLFVISAHLDLMELEAGRMPPDGEVVERLRRQVDRIRSLLVYLTQLAAADAPSHQRTSVGPIVAAAVLRAAPRARERAVTLRFEDRSFSRAVEIDGEALTIACDQLLENALGFSPDGGTIEVRVRASGESRGGARLFCEFENEGPPIAEADLPRLFTPFFSRRRQGAGLGLAIVRRVAEEAGGRATAENRAQGGVRFALELPVAP